MLVFLGVYRKKNRGQEIYEKSTTAMRLFCCSLFQIEIILALYNWLGRYSANDVMLKCIAWVEIRKLNEGPSRKDFEISKLW